MGAFYLNQFLFTNCFAHSFYCSLTNFIPYSWLINLIHILHEVRVGASRNILLHSFQTAFRGIFRSQQFSGWQGTLLGFQLYLILELVLLFNNCILLEKEALGFVVSWLVCPFWKISTLAFVLHRFAAIRADSCDLSLRSLLVFSFGLTRTNTVCSFKEIPHL